MTEKNSAGFRELLYAVLWAAAMLICCDLADTAARLYGGGQIAGVGSTMIITVCAVIIGCALVYLALTRYAAAFIYEAGKKSIRLTRKIGHREKSVEIKNREIISFSKEKPQNPPKYAHKMRKTIISDKNAYYLVYKSGSGTEMAVFEPSKEMVNFIKSEITHTA